MRGQCEASTTEKAARVRNDDERAPTGLELQMARDLKEPLPARAGDLPKAGTNLVRRCAEVWCVEDTKSITAEAELHPLTSGNREGLLHRHVVADACRTGDRVSAQVAERAGSRKVLGEIRVRATGRIIVTAERGRVEPGAWKSRSRIVGQCELVQPMARRQLPVMPHDRPLVRRIRVRIVGLGDDIDRLAALNRVPATEDPPTENTFQEVVAILQLR